MTKTAQTAAVALPTTPNQPVSKGKIDVEACLDRIAEVTAAKRGDGSIKDKSDKGIASKVAKALNKQRDIFPCEPHWTFAHVQAFVTKHGKR